MQFQRGKETAVSLLRNSATILQNDPFTTNDFQRILIGEGREKKRIAGNVETISRQNYILTRGSRIVSNSILNVRAECFFLATACAIFLSGGFIASGMDIL